MSSANAVVGAVAARPSIAPSAAPTQGVQPAANAAPNTNAVSSRDENFAVTENLCARSRNFTRMRPVRYRPKKMMTSPPMRESQICASYATDVSTVLSATPRSAKTTEKPSTKKTLDRKMRNLLGASPVPPARYARNPGTMGSTQGDRNETTPAVKATTNDSSLNIQLLCLGYLRKVTVFHPRFRRLQQLPLAPD